VTADRLSTRVRDSTDRKSAMPARHIFWSRHSRAQNKRYARKASSSSLGGESTYT
jgi:hypothetical protein